MQDWLRMSAAALGRGIAAGEIDPRALAEAHLDAAARHPLRDRIYARLTPGRARAEAAEAAMRAASGLRRGPLDGVPVSLKDLFDTAGIGTEAGSKLLAGRMPARDAACVRALSAAGVICLGKTHMSELAFSGLGVNPMTATSPNIHDPDLAPGGSSSGAAASVAYGLAPLALGSDTGGSVRIPAAWNDLCGLKTTWGLIPNDGVVPLSPSLDTIGPLARTVEDCALILGALTGRAAPDLTGATLAGIRLYLPETVVLEGAEAEQLDGFETAVSTLARAGATILRGPMPEFAETLEVAARDGAIVNTEGYAVWGEAIEAQPDAIYPMIRERFRSGRNFRADQIDRARLAFQRLSGACQARFAGCDAMIFPTVAIAPPPIARLIEDEALYAERNLTALRNTRLGNLLGLSGLTIPTGRRASGLLFTGRPFEEARLLRIGAAAEAALAA